MRIVIVGAGAMGLLFAALFTKNGGEVTLITRTNTQAASIRREGILLDGNTVSVAQVSSWGSLQRNANKAIRLMAADVLLITMKNLHVTREWLRELVSWIPAALPMVLIQNGVGHLERVREIAPDQPIWIAVTAEAACKSDGRTVFHSGSGGTSIGQAGPLGDHQSGIHTFIKWWSDTGMRIEFRECMTAYVWRKWVFNCVINPLTALDRVRNGQVLEANRFQRACSLLREAAMIARVSCPTFEWTDEELIEGLQEICNQTAQNRSSMFSDVEAGRPTEWGALNGILLWIARERNIRVPAQQQLFRQWAGGEYIVDGMVE